LARIERELERMDPTTREAFLLLRLESLNYPDIAQRLGIEVGEVQDHISHAIARLAEAVALPARSGTK